MSFRLAVSVCFILFRWCFIQFHSSPFGDFLPVAVPFHSISFHFIPFLSESVLLHSIAFCIGASRLSLSLCWRHIASSCSLSAQLIHGRLAHELEGQSPHEPEG
jgi:hypothetical protein